MTTTITNQKTNTSSQRSKIIENLTVHLYSVRYFYGPAKPVSSKDNSNGHRAALNSKSHPLYSRKISAPGNDT